MDSNTQADIGMCRMGALAAGDQFIGPDGVLYEVTTSCDDDNNGFLQVRDLNMTDAEAARLLAEPGAVEPGCDPRDGFFSYPLDTLMHRVRTSQPGQHGNADGA